MFNTFFFSLRLRFSQVSSKKDKGKTENVEKSEGKGPVGFTRGSAKVAPLPPVNVKGRNTDIDISDIIAASNLDSKIIKDMNRESSILAKDGYGDLRKHAESSDSSNRDTGVHPEPFDTWNRDMRIHPEPFDIKNRDMRRRPDPLGTLNGDVKMHPELSDISNRDMRIHPAPSHNANTSQDSIKRTSSGTDKLSSPKSGQRSKKGSRILKPLVHKEISIDRNDILKSVNSLLKKGKASPELAQEKSSLSEVLRDSDEYRDYKALMSWIKPQSGTGKDPLVRRNSSHRNKLRKSAERTEETPEQQPLDSERKRLLRRRLQTPEGVLIGSKVI